MLILHLSYWYIGIYKDKTYIILGKVTEVNLLQNTEIDVFFTWNIIGVHTYT